MGIFHSESRLAGGVEKCYNLMLLSILWCICSVTVIGIGPATTALYYAAVKSVRRKRSYPGKEFWRAMRENFKSSLLAELVLCGVGAAILVTDIPYMAESLLKQQFPNPFLFVLFLVKVLIAAGIFLYVFPILSRFEVGVGKGLGTAVVLLLRHGLSTLLMLVILMITIFLLWLEPLLFVFLPGLCGYLCSFPMEWILEQYLSPSEKETDAGKDQWYLEK